MKSILVITALFLSAQSFGALYEGTFDGDSCFLSIEQTEYHTTIASMEDPSDGPKERHIFSMHNNSFASSVDEGILYSSNLPSESSNLTGWLFGTKPKTYSLQLEFDAEGTPESFKLSSQKEGKRKKLLVSCEELVRID